VIVFKFHKNAAYCKFRDLCCNTYHRTYKVDKHVTSITTLQNERELN